MKKKYSLPIMRGLGLTDFLFGLLEVDKTKKLVDDHQSGLKWLQVLFY